MKSVKYFTSYILIASLGLWLAFYISTQFMTPAFSQDAPTAADLPPEFMEEAGGQAPPPSLSPGGDLPVPPEGFIPPPPEGMSPPPEGATLPPTDLPPVDLPPVDLPPVEASPTDVGSPTEGAPSPGGTPTEPTSVPEAGEGMSDEAHVDEDMDGLLTLPEGGIEGYIYDPTGKRDPFKPFREIRPVETAAKVENLEPLQKWELNRLEVIGILWEVKTPRAMVRDPDGVVHVVVKNTKIGRNDGVVAAIREGEVVVNETFYVEGQPAKETRILEFR